MLEIYRFNLCKLHKVPHFPENQPSRYLLTPLPFSNDYATIKNCYIEMLRVKNVDTKCG